MTVLKSRIKINIGGVPKPFQPPPMQPVLTRRNPGERVIIYVGIYLEFLQFENNVTCDAYSFMTGNSQKRRWKPDSDDRFTVRDRFMSLPLKDSIEIAAYSFDRPGTRLLYGTYGSQGGDPGVILRRIRRKLEEDYPGMQPHLYSYTYLGLTNSEFIKWGDETKHLTEEEKGTMWSVICEGEGRTSATAGLMPYLMYELPLLAARHSHSAYISRFIR